MHSIRQRMSRRSTGVLAVTMGAALLMAACSSSSKSAGGGRYAPPGSTSASAPASADATSSEPGSMFATTQIAGLGTVIVDGRGRTVYVLTSNGTTNAPCTDDTGCTKAWPDIPLPDGVSTSTAGQGVQASMLASVQANGETYPTYNTWLMYEFAGDSAAGQANGEGIKSFGGTWYALSPAGTPVMKSG